MIRQWEILHYPSSTDPHRYRLSLWSDANDVEKIRSLFSHRVGVVWIPQRKPYNCAFFLYRLSEKEKEELEDILSGKIHFPQTSVSIFQSPKQKKLSKEDTQEFLMKFDAVVAESNAVSTGLGKTQGSGVVQLGYFVPDYLPDASNRVQEILERTLYEKKVSVTFEKSFSLSYSSISLTEINRLVKKCREQSINHVIAIGEPVHMHGLSKVVGENGIFVRLLSESVISKNLWLTIIAEILSYE